MTIFIKHMVCARCKMVVQTEFEKLGLNTKAVELGEVETHDTPSADQLLALRHNLENLGFEIIDNKKARLIEQIKTHIIDLVHYKEAERKVNLSDELSSKTGLDYSYLSSLFSEIENTTIEKYFITQRIEKAKELIVYDEMSSKEIAFALNYSSVAHFSNQFKKVTGFTPTYFKTIKAKKRSQIENL